MQEPLAKHIVIEQTHLSNTVHQGSPDSVLEGRCPAEFSSNPNQTHLNLLFKVLLGIPETSRQVCWGKLELNSAGHRPSKTKFGNPCNTLTRTIPIEEPVVQLLDQGLEILHNSFKFNFSLFLTQSYDTTRHMDWFCRVPYIPGSTSLMELEQYSWQAISLRA